MSAISPKLRKWVNPANGDEGLNYWCQGCQCIHTIKTKGNGAWGWNGDANKPTFTPSVLSTSGHYVTGHKHGDGCYCNFKERFPTEDDCGFKCHRCHTFITDGRVQFLGDCSHELAGQTLDLPDLPEHLR